MAETLSSWLARCFLWALWWWCGTREQRLVRIRGCHRGGSWTWNHVCGMQAQFRVHVFVTHSSWELCVVPALQMRKLRLRGDCSWPRGHTWWVRPGGGVLCRWWGGAPRREGHGCGWAWVSVGAGSGRSVWVVGSRRVSGVGERHVGVCEGRSEQAVM